MAVLGLGSGPSSPQTVAIRPLNKGMITEGNSALLEVGSFRKVQGFDVTPTGPKRLGGWTKASTSPINLLFDDAETVSTHRLSERLQDFTIMIQTNSSPLALAITNRMMYTFDGSTGFVPVPWAAASWPVTAVTGTGDVSITITGDLPTNDVAAGDWISFGTGTTIYKIKSVGAFSTPSTVIVLDTTDKPAVNPAPPTTAKIYKNFNAASPDIVDFAIARGSVYLVDGAATFVFKFNGSVLSAHKIVTSSTVSTRTMYGAKTICYYKERLYFGQPIETDTQTYQRVRWTEALNWGYSAASNYQDLDYKSGPVTKLVAADTLMLCFTRDAVYYGQQTNLTGLPYAFFALQTGNISAVGPRAVTTLMGGCIFAGPDDVYVITMTDAGPDIKPIGSGVANTMLQDYRGNTLDLDKTIVLTNPGASRIVVAVTNRNSSTISKLWYWNYKTRGWSYNPTSTFPLVSLSAANYSDMMTVDELYALAPTATFTDTAFVNSTMDSFLRTLASQDLFSVAVDGYLYQYVYDRSCDNVSTPIQTLLETQDLDFDRPDDVKTFTEFGLRLDDGNDPGSSRDPITMTLKGTTDYGITWKSLGTLTFASGDPEDKLNFRLTGESVRFKIESSTVILPYTVLEFTVRAKVRTDRGFQRGTVR